jgi:hypothetical protein
LLEDIVPAETAANLTEGRAFNGVFPSVFLSLLGRIGERFHIRAEEPSVTTGRSVNSQVAVVGPLTQCCVADIKDAAGVSKGKPLRLIYYLTVSGLNFYQN